ncbi:MAG TPA: BON domain-containing protein [Steroidobacteraceae bacterium]|jgi:osmotically-inducible protein OsmY
MKTDVQIERDVIEELNWTPEVDSTDIAVKVTSGVVALTGFVKTFEERCAAERAVKRVTGVRALANDLEVRLLTINGVSDPELARAVADAVERELPYSAPLIRISVENGFVRLEGLLDWQYQKERAEQAARRQLGVIGVTNQIMLKDKPVASDIKQLIGDALKRNAALDADRINVEIKGTEVTLTGHVRSWSEHETAAEIAWCAPGVKDVKNHICVGP